MKKNLPTSPVLVPMFIKSFQLLRREFPLQALPVPTFLPCSWPLNRSYCSLSHFLTLNLSNFKQRKGNNIEIASCSSYKYSSVAENNVRTLKVCLQQRSSKVTWNYTWDLTLLKSPGNLHLTLHPHYTFHSTIVNFSACCNTSRGITLAASQADRLRSACSLAVMHYWVLNLGGNR